MRRNNQSVFQYLLGKKIAVVRSTKIRVKEYLRSRFPSQGHEKKPVGQDSHVRDVALQYAYNPKWVGEVEKHLEEVDYGPRQISGSHEANLAYFQESHAAPFCWNRNYQKAIQSIIVSTKPKKPLSVLQFDCDSDVTDAIPREDTHAGVDYLETGMKTKGEYMEGIAERLRIEQDLAISNGSFEEPLLIGQRFQCSGGYSEDGEILPKERTKYKERTIHMYGIHWSLTELKFSYAAQRHLGSLRFYAGGKKPDQLFQIINQMRFHNQEWVSIDYSRYDQTLPSWLITGAFNVVKSWFTPMRERDEKLWNVIVSDFIHKGFVGPNGDILYCDDGVPSGSMFTQIIDTLCNLIMLKTFALSTGLDPKLHCNICGDDNLIFHNGWFDKEVYASYIKHNFGVIVHPDKCNEGKRHDNPEYLSRFWTYSGIYRHPNVLLSKMMYPERFRDYIRNKQMTPEMIFYSYYLAYREGMREAFNMDAFLRDNWTHVKSLSERAISELPGFLSYQVRYEGLKF